MIGISKFSIELGRQVCSVEEIASFGNEADHKAMRGIGLDIVPTDDDRLIQDMISTAFQKIDKIPECIIIAHSLPFIRANSSEDMPCGIRIPTYYVSGIPCAIMHKAVELAVKLMQNRKYESILVVGADKAYSSRERVFFGTIMGDGVVMLFLENHCDHDVILSSHINTTIYAPNGENSTPDEIIAFRSVNALMMRSAMNTCMEKAGVTSVDHIVTHTSSRTFWDGMAKLCHLPRGMFLDDNICNTGHMNSHDSFYHYQYWCNKGIIKLGDISLLINPGFGGTQGCTIIKR